MTIVCVLGALSRAGSETGKLANMREKRFLGL
jgi:hypothetical protein